ncbi:cleavage and polyadenylation specificity factor subunit 4-like [Symsagittifera roscoffensis]|uniref:cleavage and polyadenylation specificity factor subunit 4-like n=1 Tax=Symsagittifera roscoffensis TaxID=84072 RepID=UPI00307BA90B
MEELLCPVDHIKFDIEYALEHQIGAKPLPFPGMDKSIAFVCNFFKRGLCKRGFLCPFRHVQGEQSVVCKHWIRGLCKKGDECEFLHAYDMSKMPECYFYQRYGVCGNSECQFLHLNPEDRTRICLWYDRGFCKHGAGCKNRHLRKVICQNWVIGFCPEGPECKFAHPKFDLPVTNDTMQKPGGGVVICHNCREVGHKATFCPQRPGNNQHMQNHNNNHGNAIETGGGTGNPVYGQPGVGQPRPVVCHHCFEPGHKITVCPRLIGGSIQTADGEHIPISMQQAAMNPIFHKLPYVPRPIESVTCFKCGDKGHYANKCPKRGFNPAAFLSDSSGGNQNGTA